MAESIFLRLLSPYKSIHEGDVDAVIMPGELGEFGVLPRHGKFTTTLTTGILRYVENGQTYNLAIGGGFAEVQSEGVTVLADSIEKPEDIDVERAKEARDRALEELKNRPTMKEIEISRWERRLLRAENRLKLVG